MSPPFRPGNELGFFILGIWAQACLSLRPNMLFRLRHKAWCLEENWIVSQEPRSRAWSCPAPLGTQWMLVIKRVHRRMTAIQHCLSLFGAVTSLLWPQFPCCKASWYRPQALYMLRFYCWMIQPSTALPGSTLSELRFDSSLWVGGPQFLFSESPGGYAPAFPGRDSAAPFSAKKTSRWS